MDLDIREWLNEIPHKVRKVKYNHMKENCTNVNKEETENFYMSNSDNIRTTCTQACDEHSTNKVELSPVVKNPFHYIKFINVTSYLNYEINNRTVCLPLIHPLHRYGLFISITGPCSPQK